MAIDIDLNRLQIFKEVALAGSFSKAAAQLRQPKSRISRSIAALERELGVQLIYRTTRQFQLTPAGADLYKNSTPLLNALKSTLENVSSSSDEVAGFLRVTVPEDFGVELMGEICHEFIMQYPNVQIDLHVGNQYVDLVKESVDVAVRVGRSRDSTMIQKKIAGIHLVFVTSPAFRATNGHISKLEDLQKLPFLAFGSTDPKRYNIKVTNGKDTHSLQLAPKFSSNNFFVLRSMAIQGTGLALLPPFIAREAIRDGRLLPALKDWTTESIPVHVLIPHQKETPLRIKKFIEFLTRKLTASF